MAVHVAVDGPLSMALLTSILYSLTFNYGSSSNYYVPSLREMWKKFKLKVGKAYQRKYHKKFLDQLSNRFFFQYIDFQTILNVFGTTQLALLRIALISLQDMEGDKFITLVSRRLFFILVLQFLAYVQLFIAFTENFTVLCRLEQPEPVRPVFRRDHYLRYAPAG